MLDRTRINISVYEIAEEFHISRASVKSIIKSYFKYCKEQVLLGYRIDFFGLVSIVPESDEVMERFSTTLAYNCREVAQRTGVSEYVVYSIMKAYTDSAIESIKAGTIVELRGLVVITPICDSNGKIIKVRSSISQTIRGTLSDGNTSVKRIRVHTSRDLKTAIQEGRYEMVKMV